MNRLRSRLAARVKQLRRAHRLTQEQLAERAGLSYKFVGEIERGTGNPSLETLEKLSDAFEIDINELFGRPDRAATPKELYALTAKEFQMVREALQSADRVFGHVERTVSYGGRRRKSGS
ncbi:MAG: helix-turn-helix transcriptional regulator [Acidobacteria bacterium]|nr:helix-turn-helix transcriptional regulator [Acidobacteriota bacterium]